MEKLACTRCGQRYYGATLSTSWRCGFCRGRLNKREPRGARRDASPLPVVSPPLTEAGEGTFERSPVSYRSLVAFAREDDRRVRSRELDIGLLWREEGTDRTYRASWSEMTGELYVVQHGPGAEGGGHVEVLGVVPSAEELERSLPGWRQRCGAPGSLNWLRDTARRALATPLRPRGGPTAPAAA